MDNEAILDAALAISNMRARQARNTGRAASNRARRQIESLKEQQVLINEVRHSLPGNASVAEAIEWMDTNTPGWRLSAVQQPL